MKTITFKEFTKGKYEARKFDDFVRKVTLYKADKECPIPHLVFEWEPEITVKLGLNDYPKLTAKAKKLVWGRDNKCGGFLHVARVTSDGSVREYITLMNFRRYSWSMSACCAAEGPARDGFGHGSTWPNRDDGLTVTCKTPQEVITVTLALAVSEMEYRLGVPHARCRAARKGYKHLLEAALADPRALEYAAIAVDSNNCKVFGSEELVIV